MFVTMICYIVASMIYFILPAIAQLNEKTKQNEEPKPNEETKKIVNHLVVMSIIARNLGAVLGSTLISLAAYRKNKSHVPHNPALALKFIDDFEIATVTTLTWQYFAVFILDQKDEKD